MIHSSLRLDFKISLQIFLFRRAVMAAEVDIKKILVSKLKRCIVLLHFVFVRRNWVLILALPNIICSILKILFYIYILTFISSCVKCNNNDKLAVILRLKEKFKIKCLSHFLIIISTQKIVAVFIVVSCDSAVKLGSSVLREKSTCKYNTKSN